MNIIEQYLDEFFKELQHTPGPWKETNAVDVRIRRMATDYSAKAIWGNCHDIMYFHGKNNANSKLISAAPSMLRELCRTYLLLLVKFKIARTRSANFIFTLDGTLSSLRNEISDATGLDGQHIQDTFEDWAYAINH